MSYKVYNYLAKIILMKKHLICQQKTQQPEKNIEPIYKLLPKAKLEDV